MKDHKNLSLARELVCRFIENENGSINATGNGSILIQLEAGDEYDYKPLPGDTLDEIRGNLQRVLTACASNIIWIPPGRNKADKERAHLRQRERIKFTARVCLALLSGDENGGELQGGC